ncbi:Hypothetical protein, putative [Bodo saltans]|uniref:Uncharacterized protein n=1 Tax=Bodo saltans TaxID=75058 RepID=A0A0S4IL34_BODSA|nr:Hypothetical protein, putative [Bodo saltans]|eukprot:CUE70410.1 Hypothetical protein, putative [Bodo saltans]
MAVQPLEALHARWSDLVFRDFSLFAQQLGGISSDRVNTVLSSTLNQGDPKLMISWLRFIIALHFQLGKLAEFTLNDRTFSALLQIVERSVQQQQQQQQGGVPHLLSDLCVSLLSLNTATASSTVGIENQLCALFLVSSPSHQRALLPLVHRSFYSSPSSSLSADTFQAMIRRQALDGQYHEFLRLFALVHASRGVLDDFTCRELLSTSPVGVKPMLGSAPVALGLDGAKCSNNRLGAAAASLRGKGMSGGENQPLPFFGVLYHIEAPTAPHVHHYYVVSAYGNAFRRAMRQSDQPSSTTTAPTSPSIDERLPDAVPTDGIRIPRIHPPLLSLAAAEELSHYLHDTFQQLANFINGKKCSLYCSKKGLGLMYIESVASECLFVAKHLCLMHHGTDMALELTAEVTNFLYCAMHAVRTSPVKAPSDEVPELRDNDVSISYTPSGGGARSTRKEREGGGGSGVVPLPPGGSAVGDPLFSPDVMIKCLEFQIAVAPTEEVLNFFQDIFGSQMWDAYLERHESFALELCLALERNSTQLRDILPSLAPRVMWLLSQQPHVLFPVVKRLIQPMMSASTNLDIFFRIVFLPLICFSNSFSPPSSAEVEGTGGGDGDNYSDVNKPGHLFPYCISSSHLLL